MMAITPTDWQSPGLSLGTILDNHRCIVLRPTFASRFALNSVFVALRKVREPPRPLSFSCIIDILFNPVLKFCLPSFLRLKAYLSTFISYT